MPSCSVSRGTIAAVPTHDDLLEGLRLLGIEASAAATRQLETFTSMLLERAIPLGMVGRQDAGRIVPRHVVDSLRAAPVLQRLGAGRVVDLGSGAGLPGLPLAAVLPAVQFTLAEARSKRAAFLELCVERLGLHNTIVHAGRAEDLPAGSFDAATARAFATPVAAWDTARPLLRPGGGLVLFAGADSPRPLEVGEALVEVVQEDHNPQPGKSSLAGTLARSGDLVMIRRT